MGHHTAGDLIDDIIDAAVANPDRADELKHALRSKISSQDWAVSQQRQRTSRAAGRADWLLRTAADAGDDGLWDNVPV